MKIKFKGKMKKNLNMRSGLYAGLLFLLLIGFGCASQRVNTAGKINNVYIGKQDFLNSLKGHFTGFVLENDRTPTDSESEGLYKETWESIIIHVVLNDFFEKYGIRVTQEELIDSLMSNIPASIQRAPVFQTKGKFDKSLYLESLLSEQCQQLDWLKRHYFEYHIPIAKLKLELMKNEVISNADVKRLKKILNSTADIDWIVINPSLTEVTVTQNEVQSYYQAHINDFRIDRYARFGVSIVPVKITQDDENNAKAKIDSIYFEIKNGKPFSYMAERYSHSTTASSGGSIGFVNYDALSPKLKSALDKLDRDSVTRPLMIDNFWVIYHLVERTKNLVKLSELAIEIIPGQASINKSKESAVILRDLAQQIGLTTAAKELDYSYFTSTRVERDSLWLDDKNAGAYLIDRAFTQSQGAILEPVYSATMQAWILAEIIEVQPFESKPLISVNDEITALLTLEKQKAKTMEATEKWIRQNRENLLQAAEKKGYQVIKAKTSDVKSEVNGMPINAIYADVVRAFTEKENQQPYQFGSNIIVPVVHKVTFLKTMMYDREEVRKHYFTHINPNWFEKWLKRETAKANVRIWYTHP